MTGTVQASRPDSGALLKALQRATGTPLHLLQRRYWDYYSSYPMEELELGLPDGSSKRVLFKDVSPQAMLPDARLAKLESDPHREIEVYRRILMPNAISTPALFAAVDDQAKGRQWLFIEKVDGAPLWQVGEFEAWQSAARWLRTLRGVEISESTWQGASTSLIRYDGDLCLGWLDRARQFSDSRDLPEDRRGAIVRLAECRWTIAKRIDALPRSFVHGEYYASNILVERTPDGWRIRPVDWEMAGIGPELLDLAALTAGKWTEEQRSGLVAAYRGTDSPAPDDFTQAFLLSRLYLALHCLAWSPSWSPPEEHQHGWLAEAINMAELLGLV